MTTEPGGGASKTTEPAYGTSAATDISLKEYIEARLTAITTKERDDVVRGRERVFMLAMFAAFAWSQIQRRLEILNHENQRLLTQQEKTVSQDTYTANEQQRKEEQHDFQEWRKEVDKDRTQSISREEFTRDDRVDRRANSNSAWQWVAGTAALLVALLAFYNFVALHPIKTQSNITTTTITTTTTTTTIVP